MWLRIIVMIVLCAPASVGAQDMMEEEAAQSRGEDRRGQLLERLREAVGKLDLSGDQRQQVRKLVEENRAEAAKLRETARENPAVARRQMAEIAQRTRDRLAEILTPEQQVKLRELMQQDARPPESETPPMAPPAPMEPPVAPQAPAAPAESATARSVPATTLLGLPMVREGAPAPELHAVDLKGRPVTLASLPRKPTVIVFGSQTCPSFRQRLPMLADFARAQQKRVHFLIVYTREAHAVGEWEVQRNKDETIEIAQPADLDARRALAEEATGSLGKDFEVAVDVMSDETTRAYGLFPNGCVVLNRDRQVVGTQKWLDAFGLQDLISRAR